jgi:hypothetical protein
MNEYTKEDWTVSGQDIHLIDLYSWFSISSFAFSTWQSTIA